MKFTRGKRIAFELFGPAALGAGIYSLFFAGAAIWEIVTNGKALWRTLGELGAAILLCLIMAYVIVGIQSILCTVIMEWRFKRGLDPRSWRMVGLSSLLGFASGLVIALPMAFEERNWMPAMFYFAAAYGGVGLVVGFLMGLLIRRWSKEPQLQGGNAQ